MDQIKKIISYNGVFPELEEDTFVAENSRLIGNVYLGKYSSIWFNCTLRGDVNHIRIGKKTNIQDGTVIHVSSSGFSATGGEGAPSIIGDNVTIGHNATIHACQINDYCLIGMGAIILDRAKISEMSFVAAGAIITPGTEIKKGELWAGNPGKFIRKIKKKEEDLIVNTPIVYDKLRKSFLKNSFSS